MRSEISVILPRQLRDHQAASVGPASRTRAGRAWAIRTFIIAIAMMIGFDAYAQKIGSDARTGKDACSFADTPSFDERTFDADTLERQWNTLRDLRARIADVLPRQKSRVEDARNKLAALQGEKDNLDKQSASEPQNIDQIIKQIDDQIAAAEKKLADAATVVDKAAAQKELQGLHLSRASAQRYADALKQRTERCRRFPPRSPRLIRSSRWKAAATSIFKALTRRSNRKPFRS